MTDKYEEMKESSKYNYKNDADIESKQHSSFPVRTGIKSGKMSPDWPENDGMIWPLVGKIWPPKDEI
jgi:hypothetical protein